MKPTNQTWACPNCHKTGIPYGKRGCEAPELCEQVKNINWQIVYSKGVRMGGTSIGIAEIAKGNEDE